MKPFSLNQFPRWKKWGLAGALLFALGTNLSFNPETKYIVRNDGYSSGVTSFATTEPTREEIDLKGSYKGLKVKMAVTKVSDNSQAVEFSVQATETEAQGLCLSCATAISGTMYLSNAMTMDNISKAVKEYVENQIDKEAKVKVVAKKEAKKKDDDDDGIFRRSRRDRDDDRLLYETTCEKPDRDDSAAEHREHAVCLREELRDLLEDCRDKVKAEQAEARAKEEAERDSGQTKKRRSTARKQVSSNVCSRLAKQYYENELRPVIREGIGDIEGTATHYAAFSAAHAMKGGPGSRYLTKAISSEIDRMIRRGHIDSALNFYNQTLQHNVSVMRMPLQQAQDMARTQTSMYLSGLTGREGNSLMQASQSVAAILNDREYFTNFTMDYQSPMQTVLDTLTKPGQRVDVVQLLNRYMYDTVPPVVGGGARPQPVIPGQRPGSHLGDHGRRPIGNPTLGAPQQIVPGVQQQAPFIPGLNQPPMQNGQPISQPVFRPMSQPTGIFPSSAFRTN